MIATERMVSTIPPKDGWKAFLKDKRRKTVNVVPRFMTILLDFDPSMLSEEYLEEFRRRYPYACDDEFYDQRDECLKTLPRSFCEEIQAAYRAEVLKDELERSYIRLLLTMDSYREGRASEDEICRIYARTRAKLIAAIGAKASAYVARVDGIR